MTTDKKVESLIRLAADGLPARCDLQIACRSIRRRRALNPGAPSPHRTPATYNHDTITTAVSVASNATLQRDPIHKAHHARQNRATLMNTAG
jgi:hypothetical protein